VNRSHVSPIRTVVQIAPVSDHTAGGVDSSAGFRHAAASKRSSFCKPLLIAASRERSLPTLLWARRTVCR
jgi:hypothetical protein